MNPRLQIDPAICHGKPVIRGTRVLVSTILGALGGGDSIEAVLEDYPNITRQDVEAALEFASRLSDYHRERPSVLIVNKGPFCSDLGPSQSLLPTLPYPVTLPQSTATPMKPFTHRLPAISRGLVLMLACGRTFAVTDADWVPMNDAAKTQINGIVTALAVKDGDLFVSGEFTQIGGQAVGHIAKWDGQTWTSLGGGLNGAALDLAFKGNDLYAGGQFTQAGGSPANRIAKWDGTSWSALGTGIPDDPASSTPSQVNAITVGGGDVYVGGFFETAGNLTVNHVARWDGSDWHALSTGIGPYLDPNMVPLQRVLGLFHHEGSLYLAGSFHSAGGVTGNLCFRWDGAAFHALRGENFDYNQKAYSFTFYNSRLFAGNNVDYGYGWWEGGVWQSPFGTPMGINSPHSLGADSIHRFAQANGDLYVAGFFFTVGPGPLCPTIARFSGGAWEKMGSGLSSDENQYPGIVHDLAIVGNHLYVCGDFLFAGGKASPYLARAWIGKDDQPVSPNIATTPALPEARLTFETRPGQHFDVFRTTDLNAGFGTVPHASGVEAHPTAAKTIYIDSTPPPNRAFYRIERQ